MNHFDYRNGVLHAEAVNLSELADAVGTPFYCYSTRDAGAPLPRLHARPLPARRRWSATP